MQYNKLNNLVGWAVFLIATTVYFMTIEDTSSLWDCGEYITAAYKLEVGHPPGAPLFMVLGRLFSFFADPEHVAMWINRLSALSSSFTILFMFWSITMLGKKIVQRDKREWSFADQIAVLGSGVVGALAYTFSDSFWFSAVEGEVYAMSSLFTAAIFWAILKWDEEMMAIKHKELAPDRSPMRWIVLIMFLLGLAIGVHLLGLLVIPALVYLIYFNYWDKTNVKGFLITGLISVVLLGFIQEGVIPGTVALASTFEVGFVNSLGLPFYSGTIFFLLLLIAGFIYGLRYANRKNKPVLSTGLWSLIVLLIGYGSFAVIVIRSNANTPLDENDPENLVTLHSYLKRDQYGSAPLLYGPYWNSKPAEDGFGDLAPFYLRRFVVERGGVDMKGFKAEEDAKAYAKSLGAGYEVVEKYFVSNENIRIGQVPRYEQNTFLPRMYWSAEPNKIAKYKEWSGYEDERGDGADGLRLPTFGENMTYMFRYQMNWMYWRYFMWNFSGRQNDIRGHGDDMRGNWISGINFVDSDRLGNQENLPQFTADNHSHNKFFFLPLVLGLIGMLFHFYRKPKDAFIVLLTFLFTGVAIIIYLNQKPLEPRERDYAFAASFYAFAMWIGIGVLAMYEAYKNFGKEEWRLFGITGGAGAVIFLVMGVATFKSWLVIFVLAALLLGIMYGLRKVVKNQAAGAGFATIIALIVPFLMAQQGWDDHDRSGKTSARDLAHNYLMSCAKNSILFTAGDNDTFPLWYYQEVEGKRTDVRVCNLSLMQTDWYTEQMKMKAYDSDPLPITFREDQILAGAGNTEQVFFASLLNLSHSGINRDALAKAFDLKVKYNKEAFVQSYTQFRDGTAAMLGSLTGTDASTASRLEAIKAKFRVGADSATYSVVEDMSNAIGEVFSGYSNQLIKGDQKVMEQIQQIVEAWEAPWDYMPLKEAMAFVKDDANMIENNGRLLRVFPTNGFILPINAANAVKSGIITAKEQAQCEDEIRFTFNVNGLMKEQIMMLDLIANNDWKRAIYYSSPANQEVAMAILQTGHLRQNGMAWELSPVRTRELINDERMYHHLMEVYTFGDMKNPDVLTDNYARDQTGQMRSQFMQLAQFYVEKADEEASRKANLAPQIDPIRKSGNVRLADSLQQTMVGVDERVALYNQRAINLVKRSLEVMPLENVIDYGEPVASKNTIKSPEGDEYAVYQDGVMHTYVGILFRAGDKAAAEKLGMQVADQLESIINFFTNSDPVVAADNIGDIAAATSNYIILFKFANDPQIGNPSGQLAMRTSKKLNELYGTTYKNMCDELKAEALDNGESLRRGPEMGYYASRYLELKGMLDAIGIEGRLIDAPAGQAPLQQGNLPQLPEGLPAEETTMVLADSNAPR